MSKRLITLDDVRQAAREGKKHLDAWPVDSIITPMARDEAERLGIELRDGSQAAPGSPVDAPAVSAEAPATPAGQPLQAEGVVRHICNLIQDRLPAGVDAVDARDLERTVREVVAAKLGAAAGAASAPAPRTVAPASGVTRADCRRLLADKGAAPGQSVAGRSHPPRRGRRAGRMLHVMAKRHPHPENGTRRDRGGDRG